MHLYPKGSLVAALVFFGPLSAGFGVAGVVLFGQAAGLLVNTIVAGVCIALSAATAAWGLWMNFGSTTITRLSPDSILVRQRIGRIPLRSRVLSVATGRTVHVDTRRSARGTVNSYVCFSATPTERVKITGHVSEFEGQEVVARVLDFLESPGS